MFRQKCEEGCDGVGSCVGGFVVEDVAAKGGEGDGEDAVEAEEGETVGEAENDAACGAFGALLLGVARLEDVMGCGEGKGHGFEASDF